MSGNGSLRKLAVGSLELISSVRALVSPKPEVRYISFLTTNFGDRLNRFFIEKISGSRARLLDISILHNTPAGAVPETYMFIGSILHHAVESSIVWGAGFIGPKSRMLVRPRKIIAVRGPLSRQILVSQGLDCPELYGDPALLMPRLYSPRLKGSKFRLGLIPHYVDSDNQCVIDLSEQDGCTLINIRDSAKNFIDRVASCDVIASSSLHGLIIAHAYGIPSVWLKLSDRISGGDFKFLDFFSSIGVKDPAVLIAGPTTTCNDIIAAANLYDTKLDLEALHDSCPILSDNRNLNMKAD